MADIIARAIAAGAKSTADSNTSQLNDIASYIEVSAVEDIFTIDLQEKSIVNVKMEIEDSDPKFVALDNVKSGDVEIFIRIKCTDGDDVTWWSNITWLTGDPPPLALNGIYRISLWSEDGLNWHGNWLGGW
jgi:hypothetical protein